MTPAELHVGLKVLGLEQQWLAADLGVQDRTVRRWLAGTTPVPGFVARRVAELSEEARAAVEALVRDVEGRGGALVQVPRPGTTKDGKPASWHWMIAGRATDHALGAVIAWEGDHWYSHEDRFEQPPAAGSSD